MEKFLNTPLHYGGKPMIDIENMKYIVEQEIKKRHFESLHYVLFDEQSSQPWAFHLFYKDGKFMINGRDDRSYVMGNTIEFTSFEDAKIAFLERLEHFVKSNQFRVQIGKTPYYSSPPMGWKRESPEDERRIRGENNAVKARINGSTIKNRGDKS